MLLATSSLQVCLKHIFVYMATFANVGCLLAHWKLKIKLNSIRTVMERARGKGRSFLVLVAGTYPKLHILYKNFNMPSYHLYAFSFCLFFFFSPYLHYTHTHTHVYIYIFRNQACHPFWRQMAVHLLTKKYPHMRTSV